MVNIQEFINLPLQKLPGPIGARRQDLSAYLSTTTFVGTKFPYETKNLTPHAGYKDRKKFTIRGYKIHSKQDFFDELSAVLQFPPYFGENWDACEECLNDLSWISAKNIILDFLAPEEVLRDSPSDFRIFSEIYQKIFVEQLSPQSTGLPEPRKPSKSLPTPHTLRFLLSTGQVPGPGLLQQWSVPSIPTAYWLV